MDCLMKDFTEIKCKILLFSEKKIIFLKLYKNIYTNVYLL